jgi:cytochrome P450
MSSTTPEAPEAPEYPAARAAGCPFDPAPALRAAPDEEPLRRVRLWDGSTPWLVTGHELQRSLLADPRVSSDLMRPGYPNSAPLPPQGSGLSFISMDNPEHARLRRTVTPPFAVRRVEALRPAVQAITDRLIDDLLAGPRPVDLVEAFALPLPSLVICDLLGVPYADHDFFQRNSRAIISRAASPQERLQAGNALTAYLDDLTGRKLADPGDDVLSEVASRVASGELTRLEAAQIGKLLLIAGHETTANMIALGTLVLLENPDQLAVLRDDPDPDVVARAVEELLRFLTITHNGLRRVALEDIDAGGRTIRAGEGIVIPTEQGNRDDAVFPDADRLDVTRDARHHLAFGFGVHQCLGQQLARMELQVVYGTLYRRLPGLRAASALHEIPFKHDGFVYGVHELPVTW